MNKILITVVIVLILGVGGFYYFKINSKPQEITKNTLGTTTESEVTKSEIKVSINILDILNKLKPFSSKAPPVFSTQNNQISFKGMLYEARNPGSNVYIDNVKIGEVEGQGIVDSGFSPDGKYFVFRVLSVCGAGCYDFNLQYIDILNKKLGIIYPPRSQQEFTGNKRGYLDINPYIDNFAFKDDTLEITFFFEGIGLKDSLAYRISPIENWNYDLKTGKYTLEQE